MATDKPITGFDPLDVADVESDDILVVVDVHDTSQSSSGSTKTLTLAALLGSVVDLTMSGLLTFTAAASKIIPGATSFSIRNHGNSADNLLVSDAGVVTARAGLTTTTGAITTGDAASKWVPGATSASIRNHADSADNLLIADSGAATHRASVSAVHFLGGGPPPTASAGTAAGGAGASGVVVTGSDSGGTLTLTTASGGVGTGQFIVVTFGTAYATAPAVTVSWIAGNAPAIGLSVLTVTTTGFWVCVNTTPSTSTQYSVSFTVIG